jgi:predicted enzyme related to lactoylglutathione lyase
LGEEKVKFLLVFADSKKPSCYDEHMDMKIELVAVPVTDVDRAKAFYEKVGFNADHDHTVHENLRFVQLTPPGSACSICIGKGLTEMEPGSLDMVLLVIDDADKAREELLAKGIEVGEVDEQPWGRFVYLIDPDGNKLSLQQLPKRG